jgi:hypothetical protein
MAALVNPANPAHAVALKAMELMAKSLKVDLEAVQVRGPDEFCERLLRWLRGESTRSQYRSPRNACFRKWKSLATRMKGLALCGEDLFYSFFGYELQ